jgi:hypothetical protein
MHWPCSLQLKISQLAKISPPANMRAIKPKTNNLLFFMEKPPAFVTLPYADNYVKFSHSTNVLIKRAVSSTQFPSSRAKMAQFI